MRLAAMVSESSVRGMEWAYTDVTDECGPYVSKQFWGAPVYIVREGEQLLLP